MSDLGVLEPMDLEKPDLSEEMKSSATSLSSASSCSICLELVLDRERATAKLHCGHEFHLDCIGSAFNAKGEMQCPNCRNVEKGRWLYANGHRSSFDMDPDGWLAEDIYDLSSSDLPFRFHWCPFRGLTQLASLIEEGESHLNSYHELLGNTTFGDHPSAPSNSHVCPYLALHGFPHHMHAPAPQSSGDSVPENNPFPRHPNNLGRGQSFADMLNSHFPQAEPQNHNWQQQPSVPFSFLGNAADQSVSQFAPRSSRNDTSSQPRLGSFIHPHPRMHGGSVSRTGTNLVASMGPPVIDEARGHAHTLGHGSNHMYHQSAPSSSVRNSTFPPIRRPRPRGVTLISSISATTSTSAEVAGFYGFASVFGSANNRSHQDAENAARHFHQLYGWGGRDGFTSLPWIPLEGEAQWWGPFNPNQTPRPGGSFIQRPANGERAPQNRQENGFQRMLPAPRMPPPSFM
ncbi:uncharacterized protein M6B38_344915 [Iris pallida]|uniref:RING-type domain-containing protein n=1 Tax=Iris pallida TaxID=29817 RepID=A0AAX6GTV3_IRIPA|nr:uncharacterized protein M6B38_344915 [Iris pallida]